MPISSGLPVFRSSGLPVFRSFSVSLEIVLHGFALARVRFMRVIRIGAKYYTSIHPASIHIYIHPSIHPSIRHPVYPYIHPSIRYPFYFGASCLPSAFCLLPACLLPAFCLAIWMDRAREFARIRARSDRSHRPRSLALTSLSLLPAEFFIFF